MKKILGIATGLSLLCGSALATEDNFQLDHRWDLTGFGSYLKPDSDRRYRNTGPDLDNDWGLGAAIGYRLSKKLSARFIATRWDAFENSEGYGVDALFHLKDDLAYVIAGYKHHDIDGQDDDAVNLGFGKRFMLNDRGWYFTAEALAMRSLIDSFTDLVVNVGVTYAWGGKPRMEATPMPVPVEPPPAQAPRDSDNDGVPDADDRCPNTPAEDAVDGSGCSRFEVISESVDLMVNFANNSARVGEQDYGEVERVAEFMRKYPDTSVLIEGHSSAQGAAAYNMKLSERRAKSVADLLVSEFGIAESRVDYQGFGEERLLDDSDTPEAHAKNRRIVAVISASKRVRIKR